MRRNAIYPVLSALLLTLALAGCRREALPEDGKAIRFSVEPAVAVDLQTKAFDALPTEADFKSKDIMIYGTVTRGTAPEVLFGGETLLSFNTAEGIWKYDPLRYWQQSGQYDFRAVSPYDAAISGSSAAKSDTVKTSFRENDDLMVASNHTATSNPVTLAFSHAEAAVRFVFKKGASETRTVQVTHFEVNNMYSSGSMKYYWDANANKDIIDWTPSGLKDAWLSTDTPLTLSDSYQPVDGWHLVVPQTLGSDAKLSFSFTVEGEDDTNYAVFPIPSGHNTWEPGKTYEYQIDIDILSIDLSFTVDSWDTNVVEGTYTIRR